MVVCYAYLFVFSSEIQWRADRFKDKIINAHFLFKSQKPMIYDLGTLPVRDLWFWVKVVVLELPT